MNIKEYQELSILDFAYEDDCLNVEWDEFEKYGKIEKKYKWDNTENRLHPKATEEEKLEYLRMVDVSFYKVVEVDVDTSSYREDKINKILD